MSIGFINKVIFAFLRFGKVIHTPPPCSNGYVEILVSFSDRSDFLLGCSEPGEVEEEGRRKDVRN